MKLIPLITLLIFLPSCASLNYTEESMSQVTSLFASGEELSKRGQFEEAIKEYTKILSVTREANDNLNYGWALSSICSAYYNLKDYKKAIEFCNQTIKIFTAEDKDSNIATQYTHIRLSYEALKENQKAIEFALLEMEINKKLGHKSELASNYMFIGRNYFKLGQYEKAMESKTIALSMYKELKDDIEIASTYSAIGNDLSDLGKKDRALENHNKAIEIYRGIGREDKLAEALDWLGQFYRGSGQLDLAIEKFGQALRLHKKHKNYRRIASTLNDLRVTYLTQGNTVKALDAYEQAQEMHQDKGNESDQIRTLALTATVYQMEGKYDKAIEIHKRYLEYSIAKEDVLGVYGGYLGIGKVYATWTKYEIALDYYKNALEATKKIEVGFRDGFREIVFTEIGFTYLHMGEVDNASEHLNSALELAQKHGNKLSMATTLRAIAGVQGVKRGYEKKIELLEQALKIYREIGVVHGVARSLLDIGTTYLRMKNNGRAREYLYESLSIAKNIKSAEIWEDLNIAIASLLLRGKKYDEAIKFLTEAVESAESLRTTAKGTIRRDILVSRITLYKYLALSYLVTGDFSKSFSAIEKSRSRLLRDKLLNENEELQASSVNQIQKQMDSNSAILAFGRLYPRNNTSEILIEYAITSDSYEGHFKNTEMLSSQVKKIGSVFSKWRDSQHETKTTKLFDTENSENYLENLVRYYRFLLTNPSGENDIAIKKIGRVLYDLLIKPLLPKLRGKKNLLIIPDGILNFLPFETLINEEGNYLIEEFDISYTQSIAILNLLRERKYEEKRKPMLAFGGATYEQIIREQESIETDIQLSALTANTMTSLEQNNVRSASEAFARLGYASWSNLPGTKLEVEAIQATIKDSNILIGDNVNETNIKKMSADGELSQYKVIHFATHGMTVPEFPELSSIVLSQFKGGQENEDGYLRMEEIAKLKLKADFVNLSACQTGLGKLYAGEGVVGLTHSFLTAGANGLSVSLWSVADESTAMFMVGVYQLVEQKGMSYSQAINEMKRAFIKGQVSMDTFEPNRGITVTPLEKSKSGKLSHPFYWAPFVYYGRN